MNILKTYICEESIEEGYKFSESGVYAPLIDHDGSKLTQEYFLQKAKDLPTVDPPEIFGMNENADIAFQMQEST